MKKQLVAAVVVGAALAISACSSDSSSNGDHAGMGAGGSQSKAKNSTTTTASIPANAAFNSTDVAFAQGMIPHHAQAIDMADMAQTRAASPQVKDLATRIKAAQDPEINQLTSWLNEWDQKLPNRSAAMNGQMDGMVMDGMMTDSDMGKMSSASGAEFDQLFLSLMVIHHEGAVAMAEKEVANGKFEPAKRLAQSIIDAQNAEIAEMKQLESTVGTSG